MWHLYVLHSIKSGRSYIGIAEDQFSRLEKHNSGSVRSTKGYRPWELIHVEEYNTKREARLRELELKRSGYKREQLFKKIERALSSIG